MRRQPSGMPNSDSDAKNTARFVGLWQVERKPDRRMEFRMTTMANKLEAVDRGSDRRRKDANGSALVQGDAITLSLGQPAATHTYLSLAQPAATPYHGQLTGSDRIEWRSSDLKVRHQHAWVRCKGLRRDGLKNDGRLTAQSSWRRGGDRAKSTWHRGGDRTAQSSWRRPAPVPAPAPNPASTPDPASMLGWQVKVQGRCGTVRGLVRQTGKFVVQFDEGFEHVSSSLVMPLPGQAPYQPPVRGWGSSSTNRMMDDADGDV